MSFAASLIYSNRSLYHLLMRGLYGSHFEARYAALAEIIPNGARVVDLCPGDAYLYRKYLKAKKVEYLGLDISSHMVRWAQAHGVDAREFDVWEDEIPQGDYVIMQASLYQFIPEQERVVDRMLDAAREKVIIAEPVHCLSDSANPVLAGLSRYLTTPLKDNGRYRGERFDEAALLALFEHFDAYERSFAIPGAQERVGLFSGRAEGAS